MKYFIVFIVLSFSLHCSAQELFVMTEPASNMPSGSMAIRVMNSFMKDRNKELNYHLMPEIMWGANAKLMLHLQSYFSNRVIFGVSNDVKVEGGSIYAKYRFYSSDDVHEHFRMAAYGRYSTNNAHIHQQEIETMGYNTGYEAGLIATKLVNKVAVSSSISFEKALNNKPNYKFPSKQSDNAANYTFSVGKLMYPKKYESLKQTNINLMCEFLGQRLNGNGKSFLDVAPSLQFIIRSQARLDLAYRRQLYSTMTRTAANGFIVKFEYTFFNVTK
jgi:hypothetical protein